MVQLDTMCTVYVSIIMVRRQGLFCVVSYVADCLCPESWNVFWIDIHRSATKLLLRREGHYDRSLAEVLPGKEGGMNASRFAYAW
jgi:hypothetical protein